MDTKTFGTIGKYVNHTIKDNKNGTYEVIIKYDGYYDNEQIFHQTPTYIVIPCVSFDTENNIINDFNSLECFIPESYEDKVTYTITFDN